MPGDSKNIHDYCADSSYLLVLGGHGVGVEPLLEVRVVRLLRHSGRLLLLLLRRRRPDPGDLSGLPNMYTCLVSGYPDDDSTCGGLSSAVFARLSEPRMSRWRKAIVLRSPFVFRCWSTYFMYLRE